MERTLSLVLDEECKVSLTLMKDEAEKIDKFTTKFENSEELKNNFKEQIDKFLEQNKDFLDYVKEQTGREYRGGIVLLNAIEKNGTELSVEREMVLYKKHLVVYPHIIKQDVMKEYLIQDKKRAGKLGCQTFTTNYMYYRISEPNFNTKKNIGEIIYFIKSSSFYEKLRLVLKAYNIVRVNKKYDTIDAIYKGIKDKEKDRINEEEEALKEFYANKTPDLRDKYKDYTIEELINSEPDFGMSK